MRVSVHCILPDMTLTTDIMFSDFFDIPRDIKRAEMFKDKGKGKGRGKEREREPKPDKKGKGKGKGVKFDEEIDVDEIEDDDDDEGRDVMGRVTGDLFDSDDEDEGAKSKSTIRVLPYGILISSTIHA